MEFGGACVSVTGFVTNDTPRPGGGCLRLKLFPDGGSAGASVGMSRMSRTSFAVDMAMGVTDGCPIEEGRLFTIHSCLSPEVK